MLKLGPDFHTVISEVEIVRVDCNYTKIKKHKKQQQTKQQK